MVPYTSKTRKKTNEQGLWISLLQTTLWSSLPQLTVPVPVPVAESLSHRLSASPKDDASW
jgi:hypothetical protein